MDSDLLPFFLQYILLAVTNMHYAKICTSYFNSINLDGRNQSFASLNMDLRWMWDNFSWQDLNFSCKGDRTSGNMMLSIFSCVGLFDLLIYSSEEIGIDPISDTFIYLRNSLLTTIVFTINHLIMYLILSGSFVFTSTRSTISLWPHFCILESHHSGRLKLELYFELSISKLCFMAWLEICLIFLILPPL